MNEVTLRLMNPDDSVNSEVKFTPAANGVISLNTSRGSQYVSIDDTTPLVVLRLPELDPETHPDNVFDVPSVPPAEEEPASETQAPPADSGSGPLSI